MRAVQPWPTGPYAEAFLRAARDRLSGRGIVSAISTPSSIGSGPNGLAAAVALARAGASVRVLEARDEIGGGTRTAELTLPGFVHDVCSAVHPMGVLSPFFRTLPLAEHGLVWLRPRASVAHPLDDGRAVLLYRSLERHGARGSARDARAYARLVRAVPRATRTSCSPTLLAPLRHARAPARDGCASACAALFPANRLARLLLPRRARARALFAGCAAHSILPLDAAAHRRGRAGLRAHRRTSRTGRSRAGGSRAIARALASLPAQRSAAAIETGRRVARARRAAARARRPVRHRARRSSRDIAGDALPAGYVRRLRALPLRARRLQARLGARRADPVARSALPRGVDRARRRHARGDRRGRSRASGAASTPSARSCSSCQQSQFDPTRAPAGKHTGYAYCHVPPARRSTCTDAIERQIERFAPGFRDRILARHAMRPADFERDNPNYVGGAITGGVADLAPALHAPGRAARSRTRRRTRASSSARRRRRPAAACTACAATSRRARRSRGSARADLHPRAIAARYPVSWRRIVPASK